jgi:hypothetical protein
MGMRLRAFDQSRIIPELILVGGRFTALVKWHGDSDGC